MASNVVHRIARDIDIHGAGYRLAENFTKGIHFSIKKEVENDGFQDLLVCYLSMGHKSSGDDITGYGPVRYRHCSARLDDIRKESPVTQESLEDPVSQRAGVPSVTKWLQNALPGVLINVVETSIPSDNVSDRDAMFAAADTYFTQQLHPNSMSTSKQAGLIVLDKLGESLDKSWLSLLSRGVFDWVICAHSPHCHSIRYMLLNFIATVGPTFTRNQEIHQLALQLEDAWVTCSITICARGERGNFLWRQINHPKKKVG